MRVNSSKFDMNDLTFNFIPACVDNNSAVSYTSFKAPGVASGLWSYTDHQTGAVYRYRIPRYYDKYLSQDALLFRKISTAWTYASAFGSSLALGFLREVAERVLCPSAFSRIVKGGFSRLVKLREFLSKVKFRPG